MRQAGVDYVDGRPALDVCPLWKRVSVLAVLKKSSLQIGQSLDRVVPTRDANRKLLLKGRCHTLGSFPQMLLRCPQVVLRFSAAHYRTILILIVKVLVRNRYFHPIAKANH